MVLVGKLRHYSGKKFGGHPPMRSTNERSLPPEPGYESHQMVNACCEGHESNSAVKHQPNAKTPGFTGVPTWQLNAYGRTTWLTPSRSSWAHSAFTCSPISSRKISTSADS